MGTPCSKSCCEDKTLKQKEQYCDSTTKNIDDYILLDIKEWKDVDCLICLESVRKSDPKCCKCDANNCNVTSHALCMNEWYKYNKKCFICHSRWNKRPEIVFPDLYDLKNPPIINKKKRENPMIDSVFNKNPSTHPIDINPRRRANRYIENDTYSSSYGSSYSSSYNSSYSITPPNNNNNTRRLNLERYSNSSHLRLNI